MGQEASQIFQKHKNMQQKIGLQAYAQLWTDSSTGFRTEFQRATKLSQGSHWLSHEACLAAALSQAERWACEDRMYQVDYEACLDSASTEEDRKSCQVHKELWDLLKRSRQGNSSGAAKAE